MKLFKKFRYRYRLVIAAVVLAVVLISTSWFAISAVARLFSPSSAPEAIASSSPPKPLSPIEQPLARAVSPANVQTKLGHFPYSENTTQEMTFIGSYADKENQRFERLSMDAALALMKLIYAARSDRVWIIPVSGFRSIAQQEKLYKDQIQRQGSEDAAAKISAPPGYSEHHTGYAVDLADGNYPPRDITFKFTETEAFGWLTQHAQEYGFEMSFPQNNLQGVSYEPWHWRFVGSPQAETAFKQARALSRQLDRN